MSVPEKDIWCSDVPLEAGLTRHCCLAAKVIFMGGTSDTRTEIELHTLHFVQREVISCK